MSQRYDYIQLWRGIDEGSNTTYINEYVNELTEAQESFRAQDSVEEWLTLEELIPAEDEPHDFVKPKDAYTDYMDWMENQKRERFAMGLKRFYNRMTELDLNGRTGKKGRFYTIKKALTDDFDPSA